MHPFRYASVHNLDFRIRQIASDERKIVAQTRGGNDSSAGSEYRNGPLRIFDQCVSFAQLIKLCVC